MAKVTLLLEQHIHGAFGINFNTCGLDEFIFVSEKLKQRGFGGFFPTLVTDSIPNIQRQISLIKQAAKKTSMILGIHLEGVFINPDKKGIHNSSHFMSLTVDNYKLIDDDFIKIVTLAPELDVNLIDYLHLRNVKVQAGHCTGWGNVNGVTHIFNAMSGINHRSTSTALSALIDDNVYTEVIADGIHISDDALRLVFKSKPIDKIILVSDALPITDSNLKETIFADAKIFYDGQKAVSYDGTIAGSTMLLDKMLERLKQLNLYDSRLVENAWEYHNLEPKYSK